LDFQAVGVVARSLDDLELLYHSVAGPDARDPASERLPLLSFPSARRLRVGWFSGLKNELVDPEVIAAVEESASILMGSDCELVSREAPYDIDLVRKVWGVVSAAGAARGAEIHQSRWRAEASGPIAAAAERGLHFTAVDYVHAMDALAEIRSGVADAWGDVDCYLCPSAASPAWPIDNEFPSSIGGQPGHAAAQNAFATWVNAIGHPGLSIPARPHADGRPLGVQIVGRFGGEDVLLEVARRLDQNAPWPAPAYPAW